MEHYKERERKSTFSGTGYCLVQDEKLRYQMCPMPSVISL
jgi:hypothetical protein